MGGLHNEVSSYYLMLFVSFIQLIALKYSFLIRGSIAVDDLYIDENYNDYSLSLEHLAKQFKDHTINRIYYAIVYGNIKRKSK